MEVDILNVMLVLNIFQGYLIIFYFEEITVAFVIPFTINQLILKIVYTEREQEW